MVLSLELANRNRITIVSEGSDSKEAVDALKSLIDSGFHYDEKPTIKIIVAEATTTIENKTGMHERPASVFVQLASKFESDIRIAAKGKVIDAKSILMIMCMGLVKGSELKIMAEGPDAQEAVKALKDLVDSKFGEE
ncbi:MAG: HPr family phosphocarrier protein [Selenomonadaceae bacterium]|nr:HPr family phosphocarrier protein [Selenomonadaceae bacterium]